MEFVAPYSLLIIYAYIMDLLFGDPKWFPHPVRGIGFLVSFLERKIRPFTRGPERERYGGMLLLCITLVVTSGVLLLLLWLVSLISSIAYFVLSIILAYTTLSSKGLYLESKRVLLMLSQGDLTGARYGLSSLVGRDTRFLSEVQIYRSLTETIAENTSDGVISPLFYLALGGIPLAILYKAVNTMDSMIGYKNKRYLYFGQASARLDDIFNYIPARLTAILMVVASFILRLDWKRASYILMRDGRKHPSPNAGLPEAAVAGALRVRLGGGAYYSGIYHPKPYIGDPLEEPDFKKVVNALKIMHLTSLLGVILATLLYMAIGGYLWSLY